MQEKINFFAFYNIKTVHFLRFGYTLLLIVRLRAYKICVCHLKILILHSILETMA